MRMATWVAWWIPGVDPWEQVLLSHLPYVGRVLPQGVISTASVGVWCLVGDTLASLDSGTGPARLHSLFPPLHLWSPSSFNPSDPSALGRAG